MNVRATLPLTDASQVTAAWMSQALGIPVEAITTEPVGAGQIGSCLRVRLHGPGTGLTAPETVLVKLPNPDPATRAMVAGTYRTETRFYTELLPTLAVRTPACLHAAGVDAEGGFALVLEDLAPARAGDQIAGCSAAEAEAAALNLAGLHGPRWSDPTLLELGWITASDAEQAATLGELYGPTVELFVDRLGSLLAAEDATTLREAAPLVATWELGRGGRFAPVHGDYRLDNLLFDTDPSGVLAGVFAVDWQTLSIGLPARDLAYLLGTGLSVADRRSHERAIVEAYRAELATYGVEMSAETAWDDYRFAMLAGPLVAAFGCAYGTPTERGMRMFAAMAQRSATAMRDLGTLEMVRN